MTLRTLLTCWVGIAATLVTSLVGMAAEPNPGGRCPAVAPVTAAPQPSAAEPNAPQPKAPQSSRPQPNVLWIVSDDHAWTDYGFMGHPQLQTPHLDRLARESLTFRRGYVPSSLCCPSLATMLTGRYPHQHKITSNDPPLVPGLTGAAYHASDIFRKGRERMNEHLQAVDTLPRILAQHGYLSLQTGKFWQGHYSHGGFTHGMTRGDRHGDDGLRIGRATMQPIDDFLDMAEEKHQPWMIWYAPLLPHDPHTPPARYLERTRGLTPSEPIAKYWAMVEWFDATIGQLLTTLEERGLAENTIVVYVADNGWIQDPNKSRYAPRSKQSPYDGGVRTPIMIRWPGKIAPCFSDGLAHSIDIVPTLLQAVEIESPVGLPGIDLNDAEAVRSRTAVYGECFTHNAIDLEEPRANLRWRWIVQGDWKLIVPNQELEPSGREELFHIVEDPLEMRDMRAKHAETAEALRQVLDQWWR